MIKITLPNLPSELLRLAITNLRECDQDPHYRISMLVWHTPDPSGDKCAVCLAGAVIAKTINYPRDRRFLPDKFVDDYNEHLIESIQDNTLDEVMTIIAQLRVVYKLSTGEFDVAFRYLKLEKPITIPHTGTDYINEIWSINNEHAYQALEERAVMLEQHGY